MRTDILLVEDDLTLGQVLYDFLTCSNFHVVWATSAANALRLYAEHHPLLLLLDVILPDLNGLEVLAEIRKTNIHVPVIMMTGTEFAPETQVRAFKLGARNYLPKPVVPEVLLAQIEQLVKPDDMRCYDFGKHRVCVDKQILRWNNLQLKLRVNEAKLLTYMLDNRERTITRSELMCHLWGDDNVLHSAQLDTLISRLKKTIAPAKPLTIEAVYGQGYMISCK